MVEILLFRAFWVCSNHLPCPLLGKELVRSVVLFQSVVWHYQPLPYCLNCETILTLTDITSETLATSPICVDYIAMPFAISLILPTYVQCLKVEMNSLSSLLPDTLSHR
jgi:hypothetical protein